MSQADEGGIAERKAEHLRIALEDRVEVAPDAGWGAVRLVHQALPEVALADVDTSVTFLGKRLALPLLVGSMTGGTDEAGRLNRRLARAAARTGVGMCLGSQRVMLSRPEATASFAVRDAAPELPLLVGNVGAVQLGRPLGLRVGPAEIARLVDAVGADALVFHLNPAQEAVQPEGDSDFAGLAERMAEVASQVAVPVGVKEVGAGLSRATVERLASLPYRWAFLESAGRGGTSWTLIEGKRGAPGPAGDLTRELGALFADWGLPTVTSCLACLRYGRGIPVVASGGLRTGLDAARALALGATTTAMALPLLKAAAESEDAVVRVIESFGAALRAAMFLVGARDLAALRRVPRRVDPELAPERWEGDVPADDTEGRP